MTVSATTTKRRPMSTKKIRTAAASSSTAAAAIEARDGARSNRGVSSSVPPRRRHRRPFPSVAALAASSTVALLLLSSTTTIVPAVAAVGFGSFFGSSSGAEEGTRSSNTPEGTTGGGYGVDWSFPIHHQLPKGSPRAQFYDDFLNGCKNHYGKRASACVQTERDRIAMNLRQPQSVQNYTDVGFKKIRAPDKVWRLLQDFWSKNSDRQTTEAWPPGNTYTNHWTSPTYMVSVEDRTLRGGGNSLKQEIWNAAKDTISEWTGQELTQCSLYGVRVYKEGAVLATHVDRMPLVSSAIINVAQDLDEPWPIEVYGHDGKAHNVTMEPGDMVLYESHSVLHGRPFPLKGRYYANIFIHFEPTGHTLRHEARAEAQHAGGDVHKKYAAAVQRRAGGHEADHDGLPSYIKEGSPEALKWHRAHPDGRGRKEKMKSFGTGTTTDAHVAAQQGQVKELVQIVEKQKKLVHAQDENGWTPLHEGARGGHRDVVEYLVSQGSKVNERTNFGEGGTALWWATETHGGDHPVVSFLKSVGALNIGPDL